VITPECAEPALPQRFLRLATTPRQHSLKWTPVFGPPVKVDQ
jgi:hypothetical protein